MMQQQQLPVDDAAAKKKKKDKKGDKKDDKKKRSAEEEEQHNAKKKKRKAAAAAALLEEEQQQQQQQQPQPQPIQDEAAAPDDNVPEDEAAPPPPPRRPEQPQQRRPPPQQTVDETVYVRTFDTFVVPISPTDVRKNRVDEEALRLIGRRLNGRCGRNGYVRPHSLSVVSKSAGRAIHAGNIEFQVHVQYDCCNPLINTLIRAPFCKCTSANSAAVSGELHDSHGNLVAMVMLPREGIVSDALTNDLAFAHLLASQHELGNVQAGDTFGCLVRTCTFALDDPIVTITGQLLSDRVDLSDLVGDGDALERRAAGLDDDDDARMETDGIRVDHLEDFMRIMVINRVDLPTLRDRLIAEQAERTAPGGADRAASASAASSSASCIRKTAILAEYLLPDDHTAHITIALQEVPLLATHITLRDSTGESFMPSFLDQWNAPASPLRVLMLRHLEYLQSLPPGAASNIRIRGTGKAPLDDFVELRWKYQKEYKYRLATTFMPAYAKAVMAHFNARRILDPCGGWGDRLAGALALRAASPDGDQTYVCFDPNRAVRRGYRRIAELFGAQLATDDGTSMAFDNGFEMHSMPFEEGAGRLAANSFDLVFTSPPFFDYEVYSKDNPKYGNDWLGRFYRPLMAQSARCVVPGGYVCIHIDDTSAGKIEHFLCEEVPNTKEYGLALRGRITLRGVLSDKPRSVWVFQKHPQ